METAIAELEDLQDHRPEDTSRPVAPDAALGPLESEGIIRADDAEIFGSDLPNTNFKNNGGDPLLMSDPVTLNISLVEVQADLASSFSNFPES